MTPTVTPEPLRILVVDDSEATRSSFARLLRSRQLSAATAPHATAALTLLRQEAFGVVIADHHMRPGPDGLWLLTQVAEYSPNTRRFLMSSERPPAFATCQHADIVEAFFQKPISIDEVLLHLAH